MMKLPKTPSFRLDGKKALVTGASSGIGLGCAVALAEAGAHVVLSARDPGKLQEVRAALTAEGWSVETLPLDVSDVAATAIAIALGADQRFTTAVPGYTAALQERIERSSTAQRELDRLTGSGEAIAATRGSRPRAPEFRGIDLWLNTPGGNASSRPAARRRSSALLEWPARHTSPMRRDSPEASGRMPSEPPENERAASAGSIV